MRNVGLAVLAITLLLRSTGSMSQTSDPGVLLRAAIEKEEVDGDLNAAIAQYKQIIANNGNNRAVAAKALLRLGGCYEKLGRAEARNTYLRLVGDYSDQTAEVAVARQRLAGLATVSGEQGSQPVFRKITIPGRIPNGAQLSPDGSRLAFASEGDIWVVHLRGRVAPDIAGEPVRLTHGARAAWGGLAWSRSGAWIAFNQGSPPAEIAVVSAAGGEPRKLPISVSPRGGSPTRAALGFSADGRHLAYSTDFDGKLALHMASAATGDNVRRLADPVSTQPAFSPNGRLMAYIKDWEAKPYELRNEVRVLRLSDESDVRVTEIPARARSPVWSPDGKFLAFLTVPGKDARSQELWITAVQGTGESFSKPTKISLPKVTYDSLAGWTTDNKIGLLFPTPFQNAIYTVPLSGGKATQVTPDGDGFLPQWSLDGTRIYFRWGMGDIAFVPAGGGKPSIVSQGGNKVVVTLPGGGNHISPDGTRIVFSAYKEGVPGVHLWTMPVSGGDPMRLKLEPDLNAWQPRWSPDGQWIAFEAERDVTDGRPLDENIFVVPAGGGKVRQLTNHTDCFCELEAWSPAGDSIAYACSDQTIRIIPVQGGEPRAVLKADGLNSHAGSLAWTRDGAQLLFTAKGRLWSVSTTGGTPTAITTGLDGNVLQFGLSPDGERIAFNAPSGMQPELWLMDDFLPSVKNSR